MWARSARATGWITAAWLAAIAAGFYRLTSYELTPGGKPSPAPRQWPARSRAQLGPCRFHLVLFAHPKCPCTRASIGELARLMARCEGLLDAHVFFLRPAGVAEGWEITDLWTSAESIPGVRAVADPGGAEAELFGAGTSGQALLYGPQGMLLFEGGITASRGHAGDNAGRDAIESIVRGEDTPEATTPVFGCSLSAPEGQTRP
jgi:hypothetical protein